MELHWQTKTGHGGGKNCTGWCIMGNRENSIRVQTDFRSEQEVYHEIHIRGAAGHWPQDLQRRD